MKYLIYVITVCLFICCNSGQNCNKDFISNYLIDYSIDKNYNYCELVNESLNNNIDAIRELSLLNFTDGMTYEHGAVILEVISAISEEKYLKAVNNISALEKKRLKSYLDAGFDITRNSKYKNNTLKKSLYKIYIFLTNNTD